MFCARLSCFSKPSGLSLFFPLCPMALKTSFRKHHHQLISIPNRMVCNIFRFYHASCGLLFMQVLSLLNPCHCKDVWSCKCSSNAGTAVRASASSSSDSRSGLAALADAAALCCGIESDSLSEGRPPLSPSSLHISTPEPSFQHKHPRDCCQSSSPKARTKKPRRQSPTPTDNNTRGPDLPPIVGASSSIYDTPTGPPPVFPDIPPLSSVASLAGSGCCCGFRCTCPGCVEHRGARHAAKDHKDCPDGCGTCIDYEGGVELPSLGSGSNSATNAPSFVDAFFARAAASIPLPPSSRATGVTLDPTNITVYPTSLFTGEGKDFRERGAAFGLIQLPKLECCAGRCGCADGLCGCGTSCDGCGEKHDGSMENCCSSIAENPHTSEPSSPVSETALVSASCCG